MDDHVDHIIGRQIRDTRQRAGLSLSELAKVVGFTKGAISKIENGTTSPPIATLMRIADALDVSIASFFQETAARPRVAVTRKNQGRIITRDGSKFGYAYEALALDMPHKLAEPFMLTIKPDDPPGEFSHGGDEFLYMVQGRMDVTIGDQVYRVGPGDSIYFDPEFPHRFKVLGQRPAKFMCLFIHDTQGQRKKGKR